MRSTTNLVTNELGRSVDAGCGYTLIRQATWMIDSPNRRVGRPDLSAADGSHRTAGITV